MRFVQAVSLALMMIAVNTSHGFAAEHIVKVITDNENGITAFEPKFLVVKKGDTVTWVNTVNDLHNVITYPDGFPAGSKGFESPYLKQAGDKWSYTFEERGTYQYHCIPHIFMGMRGTITVDLPTRQNKFHKPSMDEIKSYRSKLLEFFDSEEFMIMPEAVKRNVTPK
ncbi:MAG: plastocyanin/azurin family copper-binding protein [Kordiimonas sp.]